jgi:hypothetical protein
MGSRLMKKELSFPVLLECFFMQRLMAQRQVSPHTIRSYRDTFRLLLQFSAKRLHKLPSALALSDLDPGLIGAFLDQSEKERGNSARSRNLRLTAIRSFFRYASFEDPSQSGLIQRVLAMPSKRYEKKVASFLTRPEIDAVLAAPDRNTWAGRRDHIFLPTRRGSNWLAAFGDDWPAPRGCSAGNRCASPLPGQGAQAAMHASDQASSKCSEALVPRAHARRRPNCLSQCQRNQAQPGRCPVSVGKACRCR